MLVSTAFAHFSSSFFPLVARPFYGKLFAFIAPLTFCTDGLITIQLIDAAAAFRGAFAACIAEHGRHYAQAEEQPLQEHLQERERESVRE